MEDLDPGEERKNPLFPALDRLFAQAQGLFLVTGTQMQTSQTVFIVFPDPRCFPASSWLFSRRAMKQLMAFPAFSTFLPIPRLLGCLLDHLLGVLLVLFFLLWFFPGLLLGFLHFEWRWSGAGIFLLDGSHPFQRSLPVRLSEKAEAQVVPRVWRLAHDRCFGELERFVPQFKAPQNLKDAGSPILAPRPPFPGCSPATRIGEETLGHSEGIVATAEGHPVPAKPLVVVGVIVDLVGQHAPGDHVFVIDTGGGFLGEGGVFPAPELGVDVAGHVPHVSDSGSGLAELGG